MEVMAIFSISVFAVIFITIIVMYILKFLKGKADIVLDKYSFNSGEEIGGKVVLKLKKDVYAKDLKVGFTGIKTENKIGINRGGMSNKSNSKIIFDFNIPLDGEKTYLAGDREYPFKLQIPSDLLSRNKIENPVLDGLVKAAQILSGSMGGKIEWFVYTNLSVTGLDIGKKIKIMIN